MKLVSYGEAGSERAGLVVGERILDINRAAPDLPSEVKRILERGMLPAVEKLAARAGGIRDDWFVGLKSVRLGAPVTRPGTIVCIGLNYKDHAEENNLPLPKAPLMFCKASSCVVGPADDVVLPPHSGNIDWEVELGVVIGQVARRVKASEAFDVVAGYVASNDVSGREAQFGDGQWFRGKSFDTFAPMGPYLVTKDEAPDPHNLHISMKVNGEYKQRSNTSNLIFKLPELIEYVTAGLTLYPGDVISTGTPAGVGACFKPPQFLKAGDVMEMEVEGVGTHRTRVVSG
ncbi:MAG: FAA hydrolase family protein [Candidatus Latescibacteria bacterium]|nr:FAA hydrolase family protein [Candidatus Latescibacterota bacterium]